MINCIKQQIKNGINQIEFKVLFMLVFLVNIYAFFISFRWTYKQDFTLIRSAYDYNILLSPSAVRIASVLFFILPLVAVFIFSSNKWKNEKNGMDVLMIERMGRKNYYVSMFWAGFILTFFTFFVSFLINYLLNLTTYQTIGGENFRLLPVYDLYSGYNRELQLNFLKSYSLDLYLLIKITFNAFFLSVLSNIVYVLSMFKYFKKIKFINLALGFFFFLNVIDIFGKKFSYMNFLYADTERNILFDILFLSGILFVELFAVYRSLNYETVDK